MTGKKKDISWTFTKKKGLILLLFYIFICTNFKKEEKFRFDRHKFTLLTPSEQQQEKATTTAAAAAAAAKIRKKSLVSFNVVDWQCQKLLKNTEKSKEKN